MSWADIFYPDNPKRRNDVVRITTKLRTLMEGNFSATNDLIDLLNEHVKPSPMLKHIEVDDDATIKANADVLIARISEIQAVIEKYNTKLAQELDPELYRKLTDPDTKFKETLAIIKKVITVSVGIGATVAGIAVVTAISTGAILTGVVATIGIISTCAIAGLVVGVLALGIDMIASAIIGAIEKDKLEQAITELKDALRDFEPASREYTKSIIYVEMRIKIILED